MCFPVAKLESTFVCWGMATTEQPAKGQTHRKSRAMERQLRNDDQLLTSKEAANFLRASRTKLYRLVTSGDIVGHKVGGPWVFYKRDLIVYVDRDEKSQKL